MPCIIAHTIGVLGEQLAGDYLIKKGYSIIERNYRIRGGEIDIIAKDGNDIVFIEVKLRSSNRYGYPEEAVSFSKCRKIMKAIRAYLQNSHYSDANIRFDIIAIENNDTNSIIRHIENIELPHSLAW